jgi:hypothetical protein
LDKFEIAKELTVVAIQNGLIRNNHGANVANDEVSKSAAECVSLFFNTLVEKLDVKA